MSEGFILEGVAYEVASNWFEKLPVNKEAPLKYLEIGAFYGANLLSVAQTYGAHPNAELHCIDPWCDYSEYPEYKGEIESIYGAFKRNIKNNGIEDKVKVHRGFSHEEIPKLQDKYFDLIYVDGNHEAKFVLEDAVLAFRKLVDGGWMIFDDWNDTSPQTQRGIKSFLQAYSENIEFHGLHNCQIFIRKIKD